MIRLTRRTALACLVASTFIANSALAQAPREIKIGYALAINSHYGAGAQAFASHVESATTGALKFRQFPSSALGGERETVEGVQLGTVEAAIVSTGVLSNFVPEVGVTDIPFLFRNTQHARAVLDGPVGQELLARFRARGLVALAWGEQGFRHVTNSKHAVSKPHDLKGLKLRTMENPVHITAFRALGAAPTPMAWPEVITALQQGTIDGQENPLSVIVSAKLAAVQKHLALTSHVYSPAVLLVSPKLWASLSEEQKVAVAAGAKEGARAMRNFVDETERKAVEDLRGQGMLVTEVSDKAPFQSALASVYKEYQAKYGKDVMDRIINTR